MYAGHAAVALAIKARAPKVPAAVLVVACFGPDWTELVLGLWIGRSAAEVYSHWIPAVVGGALLAAGVYALVRGQERSGVSAVLIGWLLHWPADFLTARKPLLDPQHVAGLQLYQLPAADFAVEGILVVLGCLIYRRAYATDRSGRRWVLAIGAALLALQGMLDFGLAHAPGLKWKPALAERTWRPQHMLVLTGDNAGSTACLLRSRIAPVQRVRKWRPGAPGASSHWCV